MKTIIEDPLAFFGGKEGTVKIKAKYRSNHTWVDAIFAGTYIYKKWRHKLLHLGYV